MDPNQQPQQPHYQQDDRQRRSVHPESIASKIGQIIWLGVVLVVILLGIRVVLSLIGANQDNDFAAFVYNVSYVFVEPFRGLLQVGEYQVGVSRLEFETIVGIFVYLIVGWAITAGIKVLGR